MTPADTIKHGKSHQNYVFKLYLCRCSHVVRKVKYFKFLTARKLICSYSVVCIYGEILFVLQHSLDAYSKSFMKDQALLSRGLRHKDGFKKDIFAWFLFNAKLLIFHFMNLNMECNFVSKSIQCIIVQFQRTKVCM